MLLFLYGPDTWRKNQKLKQITEKFVREVDPSRLNVVTLESPGCDEETLRNTLRAAPFLARKRLFLLNNFLLAGRKGYQEILREFLPRCGDDRIAVISEDESKPKTWKNQGAKAVWEYLEKNAQGEEFKPLWGAKLEAAIAAQAKTHGLVLEKEAAALLSVMSGGDLGWVANEMEKIGAYCNARNSPQPPLTLRGGDQSDPPLKIRGGAGGVMNTVTSADIKLLCTSEGEANIFEFLDALGIKDQKTLLRTAEEQLQESDALHLVNRATGHLRALLAMKLAGEAGAQALKLHPFQAKKISAQLRHWDPVTIKRFLFQLLALEYATKSGRVADPKTQLTSLLARIT